MHFNIATSRAADIRPRVCLKNVGSVSLRQREARDYDALMKMFRQPSCRRASVLDPLSDPAFEQWLSEVNPRNFEVVALLNDRVIGLSGLFPAAGFEHQCATLILFVHDGFQGQGIGTLLLTALVATAQVLGFERLELSVFRDNARAVSLYEKFGFGIEPVAVRSRTRLI